MRIILAKNWENSDIIAIDDNSTDNTYQILKSEIDLRRYEYDKNSP